MEVVYDVQWHSHLLLSTEASLKFECNKQYIAVQEV